MFPDVHIPYIIFISGLFTALLLKKFFWMGTCVIYACSNGFYVCQGFMKISYSLKRRWLSSAHFQCDQWLGVYLRK